MSNLGDREREESPPIEEGFFDKHKSKLKLIVIAVGATVATPVALTAAGFGASGVVAGSTAAAI